MTNFAKIKISGVLEITTGLHIGASTAFSAIGATDSPVIRDPLSKLPIIPGSTLKGKMRSLLAKAYNQTVASSPSQDSELIRRVFGDSMSDEYKLGRLIVRDAIMINSEDLLDQGARTITEVKFENTIDRIKATANPRQIERVIAGSKFAIELIYDMNRQEELEEDLNLISDGLKLLELDYLGGHGSRGYGRVAFSTMVAEPVFGDLDASLLKEVNATFINEV